MSRYIPRTKMSQQFQMPNQFSVLFHKNNLINIKKALGKNCTMVSHLEYPRYELQELKNEKGEIKKGMLNRVKLESQYGVIAKFKGQVRPIVAMLNGTPYDIKGEYYAQLKNDMVNAASKKGLL